MAQTSGTGIAVRAVSIGALSVACILLATVATMATGDAVFAMLPFAAVITVFCAPVAIGLIIALSLRLRSRDAEPSTFSRVAIAAKAWGLTTAVASVPLGIYLAMVERALNVGGQLWGTLSALSLLVVPVFTAGIVAALIVEGIASWWRERTPDRPTHDRA